MLRIWNAVTQNSLFKHFRIVLMYSMSIWVNVISTYHLWCLLEIWIKIACITFIILEAIKNVCWMFLKTITDKQIKWSKITGLLSESWCFLFFLYYIIAERLAYKNIWTNMFNFNRDKNIWFLPSNSLDKNLHSPSCHSSTMFHDVLNLFSLCLTARKLLVMFGYLLGMLQHWVISQGFVFPRRWNSLKPNLGELTCHIS